MTDTSYQTFNPMADPAEANRVVQEAMQQPAAPQYVEESRPLRALPVTSVRLPGGHLHVDGSCDYDVEVRELNGEDEEALAKASNLAKALMMVIDRATVKVGETQATSSLLNELLAGDRETILLQIRKATYGTTEEFTVSCRKCGTEQQTTVDLDADVKLKELASPEDRFWTMQLRGGEAKLSLPSGATQRKVALAGENSTVAELNTIIIGDCLESIGGNPSFGAATARKLGLADRAAIIKEISERQPGPQLSEVVKKCENCNDDMTVSLNLALLFRL